MSDRFHSVYADNMLLTPWKSQLLHAYYHTTVCLELKKKSEKYQAPSDHKDTSQSILWNL